MKVVEVDSNTVVYRPETSDKLALKNLYDVLNKVNQRENKKDLFYTKKQIQDLKRDTTNIFL